MKRVKVCPNCGHKNHIESMFCIECGEHIEGLEVKEPKRISKKEKLPPQQTEAIKSKIEEEKIIIKNYKKLIKQDPSKKEMTEKLIDEHYENLEKIVKMYKEEIRKSGGALKGKKEMIIMCKRLLQKKIEFVEIDPNISIKELKRFLANYWNLEDPSKITLLQGGDLLREENATLREYYIKEYDMIEVLSLHKRGSCFGQNLVANEIGKEYSELAKYLKKDKEIEMVALGENVVLLKIKIKNGYTYDLAQKNIWPFTEYIKEHYVKIEIPPNYPQEFPILTWLSDIHHPNIISKKESCVVLMILRENWPNLIKGWPEKELLPCIALDLKNILKNPYPNREYGSTLKEWEALRICKQYGFPRVHRFTKLELKKGLLSELEDNKLYLKHLRIMYEKGEVRDEIYERMKKRYEAKIRELEKQVGNEERK